VPKTRNQFVAFPLRTHDRHMLDLEPPADRFKRVGGIGPATVRHEGLWGPIPDAGGVEDHQRSPCGFRWGHRAREDGAGVPLEDHDALPLDAVQGKVHLAAINEPILMAMLGLVGVRLRRLWPSGLGHVGNVIVHQFVSRHHTTNRADGDVRLRQQAPDPKLARIGMRLLEAIHLHHPRKPDFARWLLGAAFFVQEPRKVLGLEAPDPPIDRGPRHVQTPADTHLVPALIVEFDDLKAGLVAVRMGRGLPPRQGVLSHHRTLLPQLLGGFMVNAVPEFVEHDPGEFPRMKPCIERLELIDLLAHSLGHPGRPAWPRSRDIVGEQPKHALLPETGDQPPHGIGMCVRVLCPLRGCSICQEDQGADELVPPLDLIHEVQLKLGKLSRRVHGTPFSLGSCGERGLIYHTRG
jgi:hypothetical protein